MALPKRKEIVFAVLMTGLSAALLGSTYSYPSESVQFPRFLIVLQLLFSIILLLRSLRLPSSKTTQSSSTTANRIVPFQIFTAISAYILAIEHIGYFVATALFLMGSMYLFGRHRATALIGVTAAFLLTVYILFGLFIGVRLPEGLLF